jgi:hypothetical protein
LGRLAGIHEQAATAELSPRKPGSCGVSLRGEATLSGNCVLGKRRFVAIAFWERDTFWGNGLKIRRFRLCLWEDNDQGKSRANRASTWAGVLWSLAAGGKRRFLEIVF